MPRSPPILVVAPWGDPYGWQTAKYIPAWDNGPPPQSSVSSLKLVVEEAKRRTSRFRILILVQETLLAAGKGKARDYPPPHEVVDPGNPCSYREALSLLSQGLKRFASNKLGVGEDSVEVRVLPGVGRYRYRLPSGASYSWAWMLHPELKEATPYGYYASMAAIAIMNEVFGIVEESDERLILMLDTTHGVNYTSIASREAVELAAEAASAAAGLRVKMEVYNSEPFIPGSGARELRVWRVDEREFAEDSAVSALLGRISKASYRQKIKNNLVNFIISYDKIVVSKQYVPLCAEADGYQEGTHSGKQNIKQLISKRIVGSVSAVKSPVKSAIVSLAYGAPLLALQAGYELREALESELSLLEMLIKIAVLLPSVEVKEAGGGLTVIEHLAALEWHSLQLNVAAAAIAAATLNRYKVVAESGSLVVKECDVSRKRRVLVDLNGLKLAAEAMPTTMRKVVLHEISRLEGKRHTSIEDRSSRSLYSRYIYGCKDRSLLESQCKSPVDNQDNDGRIFVAHAGLNRKIVEVVCREDGKPLLGYCCEAVKGKVLNNLVNSLLNDLAQPTS